MKTTTTIIPRTTKFVEEIMPVLKQRGHATNHELMLLLQETFPDVSATTVHRLTNRLKERGLIGLAPPCRDGSARYDSNPQPHHHFMCTRCDRLCDVEQSDAAERVIANIKQLSADCAIAGSLTMQGICKKCN